MSHPRSPLTRRTVIGTVGAAAAAIVVPPLSSAAAAEPAGGGPAAEVPSTRAWSGAGAAATAVRGSFPIGYVGVSWTGSGRGAQIRFHRDGEAPGGWQPLTAGCAGGPDDGLAGSPVDAARSCTALVAAQGASGYDLRLPDGAGDVRSAAIDTVRGPALRAVAPVATPALFAGIEYLSRAAWGADESKRFKNGVENSPTKYYPLQALTVHHTDTPNADPDPAATVRAVYEYHAVTLDWGDIGYHFLIDEAGRIYEGRYSGTDGLPAHDAAGNLVTAFHTGGFNSGNLGIALLGTLTDGLPTERARNSLTVLLTVLTRLHDLDPQARITFANPVSGVTKDVDLISGHRDWLATDCPGGTMYATLPALRADVAHLS